MIKNILSVIIFVLLIVDFSAAGPLSNKWTNNCIDLTINGKFNQAQTLLNEKIFSASSAADSIEIYFYLASVLNSKMTHYENRKDEQLFRNTVNDVQQLSEKVLDGNLSDSLKAQLLFYKGSAIGFLAFFQGQHGEWFSALKNGKKSIEILENVVKLDSTLFDAYLGIGTYKYWLSSKLNWLFIIPDQREEGIALIKKALKSKNHGRYLAMHQLIYILLDYGDYNQAETIAREVIKTYPQSQFMNWAYSHVYMKKKSYAKAIQAYKDLLKLIEQQPNANPNHRITCLARLAYMYAEKGQCNNAGEIVNQINNNAFYKQHKNEEIDVLKDKIKNLCKASP